MESLKFSRSRLSGDPNRTSGPGLACRVQGRSASNVSTSETRTALAHPIVCLYPADAAAAARLRSALGEDLTLFQSPFHEAERALEEATRACPGRDVLLVAADCEVPPHAWERLQLACATRPEAEVWTPLCAATAALDPRSAPRPTAADDPCTATLDSWLWLLSDRGYPQSSHCSTQLSLWRSDALARCLAAGTAASPSNPLIRRMHLCDTLLVGSTSRTLAPEASETQWRHPTVAALRQRLADVVGARAEPIGLDERPVLLHVLHGWGGGAQRFVDDLIAADRQHRHLVLIASGSSQRRVHGELIELRTAPDGQVLRRWPLAAPAAGTRLESAEYRTLLDSVCIDFRIAGVLISSLIGHSVDALRSGRPTAIVCHDYYPLWPVLHADFGSETCSFEPAAMAAAIAAAGPGFEFAERAASHWQALRAAYLRAVSEADALLIAPSRCVRDNQCRIAPELAARRWREISHGLAPWAEPLPEIAPDLQRAALRVVIPGRIRGGKGEHLLAALLQQLPVDVELILLGCGAAGMRFFGHPQVHVLLDYQRDQLPQLLAQLRPDLALLPASVAETFSYMLSELRALGVPVVATALGSFVERIAPGRDGLLVAPQAEAIAELLHRLSDDCAPLAALRQGQPGRSIAAMAADYAEALALASPSMMPPSTPADALLLTRVQQAESTLATTAKRIASLRGQLEAQDIELERRADWATREHRQATERLAWVKLLQGEVELVAAQRKALDEQLAQTERELQARSAWAHSLADSNRALESDLAAASEQRRQLEQVSQEVGDRLAALLREESRLREHVAGLIEQRDQFEAERNRILASLSWRLTRPLRYLRRLLGSGGSRLRFRLSRFTALQRRAINSLRVRGLAASWRRLRQELRPAQPATTLAIPGTPEASPVGPSVEDIELPRAKSPRASVIVPVYNQLAHTLTCLRALANQAQRTAFEVIVVDDCSSDASAELLPQVRGLRYLRNRQNLGFIGACNAGAAVAEGEYLVFLNNDTAVQANWLDALIGTFSQRPDAGLVGAKLVYPDGRLQEAGGIVFCDGSGWNYGRFEDPADPRFGFLREADYCSGAAIALPAELFHSLGGFDTLYAPAYYEDTDLAMKVRAGGLAVLYQPASVVVHFEGVTSGTDTSSGVKAYQVVNQQKFLARWRDTLTGHCSPPPTTPISVARQQRARRRVLVIDATTPQPDQDSGSLRLVNLLRLLIEDGCAVTFFADNRAYVSGYTEALQQLGVEVLWHPWLSDPVAWFSEHGPHLHSVLVSRHYIACSYLDLARRYAPQARFIFDTVDLHYLREQRAADLEGRADLARSAAQTRQQELAVIERSDITLVVSPVEQALLASDAPGARVEVLSNVHEVFGCRRTFAERRDLMFIGGYQHPPNVDAACWFVGEVWPLLHAADPTLCFHLIGSKASDEVRALGEVAGVIFHGHVEDIEPFLDGCRLAVAPLRYGAGVKGKVNMSMSYGQPVVATPTAVEGMHLRPDQDVLVAESPEAFAQQVLRLYGDAALWQTLSDNGTENVRRHFGFDAARAVIRQLLD
jgi:GT2 family glycosyltransferase/glycosyltransferase involved in cell wall biosynthesis